MTKEEKIQAIDDYCSLRDSCNGCPLENEVYCINEDRVDELYECIRDDTYDSVDSVNHPEHYNSKGGMECIDEMVVVFGKKATMDFCLLNVWKYRYRAAFKNGNEDIEKAHWYMNKYKQLQESMEVRIDD